MERVQIYETSRGLPKMEIKEAFGADHPATDTNLDVCLRRMEHREALEAT